MVNLKKEICMCVIAISQKYPELRFQQIMTMAATKAGWLNDDLFYCPDEIILKGLNRILTEKQ